jgi:hypothetical protein
MNDRSRNNRCKRTWPKLVVSRFELVIGRTVFRNGLAYTGPKIDGRSWCLGYVTSDWSAFV